MLSLSLDDDDDDDDDEVWLHPERRKWEERVLPPQNLNI